MPWAGPLLDDVQAAWCKWRSAASALGSASVSTRRAASGTRLGPALFAVGLKFKCWASCTASLFAKSGSPGGWSGRVCFRPWSPALQRAVLLGCDSSHTSEHWDRQGVAVGTVRVCFKAEESAVTYDGRPGHPCGGGWAHRDSRAPTDHP